MGHIAIWQEDFDKREQEEEKEKRLDEKRRELISLIKNNPEKPIMVQQDDVDAQPVYTPFVGACILQYVNGVGHYDDTFFSKDDYKKLPETEGEITQDDMDLLYALYPDTDWDEEPAEKVIEQLKKVEWKEAIFIYG